MRRIWSIPTLQPPPRMHLLPLRLHDRHRVQLTSGVTSENSPLDEPSLDAKRPLHLGACYLGGGGFGEGSDPVTGCCTAGGFACSGLSGASTPAPVPLTPLVVEGGGAPSGSCTPELEVFVPSGEGARGGTRSPLLSLHDIIRRLQAAAVSRRGVFMGRLWMGWGGVLSQSPRSP